MLTNVITRVSYFLFSVSKGISSTPKTVLTIKIITYNLYLRCKKCLFPRSMAHFMRCCGPRVSSCRSLQVCRCTKPVDPLHFFMCLPFFKSPQNERKIWFPSWWGHKSNILFDGYCYLSSFQTKKSADLGSQEGPVRFIYHVQVYLGEVCASPNDP